MATQKLLALRKEVEAALGPKFNGKKFHDFLLSQGLLPPDLMRKAVMGGFCKKHNNSPHGGTKCFFGKGTSYTRAAQIIP
jgi:hypothetical protein